MGLAWDGGLGEEVPRGWAFLVMVAGVRSFLEGGFGL